MRRNNEYAFESRVRFSEVDHHRRITLPAIINYFQDCSTFQSEELDLGLSFCERRKRAWVLSSWQVEVERYPELGEAIRVRTWASGFQGLYGYRNFCLEDEAGHMAAYAHSVWVYVDTEKGRPVKALPEDIEKYGTGEPLDMEYESRKITLPKQTTASMYRWQWNCCRKRRKFFICVQSIRSLQFMETGSVRSWR